MNCKWNIVGTFRNKNDQPVNYLLQTDTSKAGRTLLSSNFNWVRTDLSTTPLELEEALKWLKVLGKGIEGKQLISFSIHKVG